MSRNNYEMDMCHGPLLKKILIFSIPLMLSTMLQLLFNAADLIVVGQYAGSNALAAVGATSSLINLLTNLFIGLSIGSNVLIARLYGAHDEVGVSKAVHTAILTSLISGLFLTLIGVTSAKALLSLMNTPPAVLNQATLYLRIYFMGMPAMMLYNFGSSILRALGDTQRPLYFLGVAGIINVILNLIFVICFSMDVAGVALATIISQCISALLILRCLMRQQGCLKLELRKLHIYKDPLLQMLKIGLPAGLQGVIFSISNVLIQSSINIFGETAMAGNTAASNIEAFIYGAMNSLYQTSLTFTSQNIGGKAYHRINKILYTCLGLVIFVGVSMGGIALIFAEPLLQIFSPDPDVISYGVLRMTIICSSYFLCGMMDVFVGSIRGLGYSILPMIVSLIGACGLRIVWIYTIFKSYHTLDVLYLSYPVTWIITILAHLICYYFLKKKTFIQYQKATSI